VIPLFRRHNKPLLACYLGQKGFGAKLGTPGKYVPSYTFPENAVAALAKVVEYAERREKPKGKTVRIPGIKHREAQEIVDKALLRSIQRPLWLTPEELARLLDCYGIRFAVPVFAKTAAEAGALAEKAGFPVAVKLASATIVHKTDVGGVALNLTSASEVEQAFQDISARLTRIGREAEMEGVIVQPMVPEGIETIVGVSHDPSFGPLIMFGVGGVNAELINDVAFRLHPLTDLDARELIGSIKMNKIFDGHRGTLPSDKESLEDLLLRLSTMIEDNPHIEELDFNPVKVLPKGEGYRVVDARIAIS
jgi:acetyltransferase